LIHDLNALEASEFNFELAAKAFTTFGWEMNISPLPFILTFAPKL